MRNIIRKNLELNADPVKWFEETYPNASLSNTLSMLLEKFMLLHPNTPEEYAEIAARQLKEEAHGH